MKKYLQSPGSLQNSSTKRIIQTVQNLLNQDQEVIIHQFQNITFSPQNVKNIVTTNAQKLNQLMTNPKIRNQINQFMWKKGYGQIQAIIKLTLIDQVTAQFEFQLLQDDIIDVESFYQVFKRFGSINKVELKGSYALIKFSDNVSAYFAQRCLNGHKIRELCLMLKVQFLPSKYQQNVQDILIEGEVNRSNQKTSLVKHTCRYQIQIENEKEFQVARKIIGPKGINMKKIIDSCISQLGDNAKKCNDVVKLRLRGKGSGYRQGPSRIQSDQKLHLCVSSRFQSAYGKACIMVEQLLINIYNEKQQKQLLIKKLQAGKMLIICENKENKNYNYFNEQNGIADKLNEFEVKGLIEARNRARRQSNFIEADRIRNYLRLKGIILIDQKGGRGKGVEVTTWKYVKLNKQFMHETE